MSLTLLLIILCLTLTTRHGTNRARQDPDYDFSMGKVLVGIVLACIALSIAPVLLPLVILAVVFWSARGK